VLLENIHFLESSKPLKGVKVTAGEQECVTNEEGVVQFTNVNKYTRVFASLEGVRL
jgi:hypothetical protein